MRDGLVGLVGSLWALSSGNIYFSRWIELEGVDRSDLAIELRSYYLYGVGINIIMYMYIDGDMWLCFVGYRVFCL